MNHYLKWLLFVLIPMVGSAQNDTSQPRKNVLTAGVNYQSKLHFYGRTDSLQSAGSFPTLGFELKQGFYANSSFVFVNNAVTSAAYTGAIVEGGFKFPTSKNFSGNVFYTQFLYRENSQLVQSALKSQTGINLGYNNKIVNVNAGADARFSDKTDIGLTAGLEHLFIYLLPGTKNALAVNPSFYTYAGTQNFTPSYSKRQQLLGLINAPAQQRTELLADLNILAYEMSVPVVFVVGKFNASLTASYVLPQNLIAVANRPDLSERGNNMLYVTAGLGVRL